MPIASIHFTKISAERKAELKGKINISNNVVLTDVKKQDFKLPNQESIKVMFDFNSKYDPSIGTILISGEVLIIDNQKVITEILEQWKKDKKLPDAILAAVMNNLLTKCNIEAILIGREVNLPPTLNMPKVKINK